MPRGNGGVIGPANIPTTSVATGVWSLSELTLAVRQSIWPSPTPSGDPYFEYTTLLLPGSGTNGAQNNTFLDGSTNNFTITRNGNTTQGTFSPFSQTGWGGYASATGQYLTAATSTAFDPGSSNFTVEAWIYPTALNTYNFIYSRDGATNATSQINLYIGATGSLNGEAYVGSTLYVASSSAGAIVANRWTHVAFVRNGTTTYLYIDGVQNGTNTNLSTSSVNTISVSANILNQTAAANRGMQGYCSNFRFVIGVAVYTGAFTPPTTPLAATQSSGTNISAITGTQTKILTFQSNRFIDNSVANSGAGWTLTVNGSLSVQAFSPFNPTESWSAATYGGSGYFDGSGDYLSIADNAAFTLGSNDFTVEAWVYKTTTGTVRTISAQAGSTGSNTSTSYSLQVNASEKVVGSVNSGATNYAATSSGDCPLNAWTHIVLARDGNTLRLYINGIQDGTASVTGVTVNDSSDILGIGSLGAYTSLYWLGYLSNFRLVKGTCVYPNGTTFTPPTAPLTAITNTSLLLNFTNAGIYDATSKNDLETVGDAQISNTTAKWGSTSIKFDGTGDYLRVPDSPLFSMGSGNFTIDGWVYRSGSGATQIICCQGGNTGSSTSFGLQINSSNQLSGFVYSGTTIYITNSTATVSANQWVYVAMVRDGNTITLYINGSADGTLSVTGVSVNDSAQPLGIGTYGDTVGGYFNGYIQDLRITRGYARTITTPTAAFPTL